MTLTVGSLLELPELRTSSLTPGVGEDRPIAWAHVCELPEPWLWLGRGALVMTTGIGVPASPEAQRAYLAGLHGAEIAALAIDSETIEHPFSPQVLGYAAAIGFPVLQTAHEVPFVTLAQAVAEAGLDERVRRLAQAEQLHGSLLLSELCGGAMPSDPAARLVASYEVEPPYALAVADAGDARTALDAVHAGFSERAVPVLATIRDRQLLILSEAGQRVDEALESLTDAVGRIGVSAGFSRLEDLQTALRQARSALIRNHQTGRVLRFEENTAASLFLPGDPEQLRGIARQVLGPLRTYDEQRGTSLTQTLRVFLEENRSWVRAAERLFVHRQTLIARVSRIEKIIDRDLSSIEDTAECWLAVQAAIGCGELEPSDTATPASAPGTGGA
ncbi:PucR family transcriptional regulator [Leucobacter massiliensis]|uniref:PucR family transcriptional regulator n=1 Tax=Leucobacter massiliensis TaxID=1686285 RepID=A0A2S9QNC8_9MICO|nr:PucR family transcriptional regulator [Leucobacter massiliensis]PRI11096.1 hypothetical protein B4915_09560 [Leucobacter massiliensis]